MDDIGCPEKLVETLRAAGKRIEEQEGRLTKSESDTRRVLIGPILDALGWDIMDTDTVKQEYTMANGRPDYVLFMEGVPCVMIEAKKLQAVDEAEAEIKEYCSGTHLVGVATDGQTWLVLKNGSWARISIGTYEACSKLFEHLSKASIEGNAIEQVRKEFDSLIKKFNAVHPGEDLREYAKNREDTNRAIRLFSEFVVTNKSQFRDENNFHRMLRAYLNILQYAEKKVTIKAVLNLFDGLDPNIKSEIVRLSQKGKYVGVARTLRKKDTAYRTAFLDLIETFTIEKQHGMLVERFRACRDRVRSGGTAALTGILSSLQPEQFIVYNKRSSSPLVNTNYKELADIDISRYELFNHIYRKISQYTKKSLVELDVIANELYYVNEDLNYLGVESLEQDKYDEAIECFDKAIEIDPNHPDAHYNKGDALERLGRNEEAIECFDKAIKLEPDDANAYNGKGLALNQLGRYGEAIECLDRAIELKSDDVDAYFNKGRALYQLGRNEEAIECLDKVVKIDPNYPDVHYNKGDALERLGRNEEAIECFDKVIKLEPDDANAYNGKGLALNQLGKYEEAIECFDKAIKLEPDDAVLHGNKGLALDQSGRYEEAIECFDKAIKIDPNHPDAHYNKGDALERLGRNGEAIECFDKVIKLEPDDANAYNGKGLALNQLGKYEEAIECFDKAIKLEPDDAVLHGNKGLALDQSGRYEEAIECFDKAIEIDPNHPDAHYNKGDALERLGRNEDAI